MGAGFLIEDILRELDAHGAVSRLLPSAAAPPSTVSLIGGAVIRKQRKGGGKGGNRTGQQNNRTVWWRVGLSAVTGTCGTVGFAGLTLGGGLGCVLNRRGLEPGGVTPFSITSPLSHPGWARCVPSGDGPPGGASASVAVPTARMLMRSGWDGSMFAGCCPGSTGWRRTK